jgi:hypothetical protein
MKHFIRTGLVIAFGFDIGIVLGQKKVSVRVEVRDKASTRRVYQGLNSVPKRLLRHLGGWRDLAGHGELGRES